MAGGVSGGEGAWRNYRKKPVVVQAYRLKKRLEVRTLEGVMTGEPGDWLIRGVKGECYPCRDDIFRATYEACGEDEA